MNHEQHREEAAGYIARAKSALAMAQRTAGHSESMEALICAQLAVAHAVLAQLGKEPRR